MCSATFLGDLLLPLANHYHTISTVTGLQAANRLEVACLHFRVLRDVHLSIDLPISPRLLRPSAAACCISSRPITTKHLLVEEVTRPIAQRFGEWASASRTFHAVTALLAVAQCEVARLLVFAF